MTDLHIRPPDQTSATRRTEYSHTHGGIGQDPNPWGLSKVREDHTDEGRVRLDRFRFRCIGSDPNPRPTPSEFPSFDQIPEILCIFPENRVYHEKAMDYIPEIKKPFLRKIERITEKVRKIRD